MAKGFSNMGNMMKQAQKLQKQMLEIQEEMSKKTGLKCSPLNGWMIWGGKYSIFVVNNTGVIIETKKANFKQLMVDLFISGPTGPRLMPS